MLVSPQNTLTETFTGIMFNLGTPLHSQVDIKLTVTYTHIYYLAFLKANMYVYFFAHYFFHFILFSVINMQAFYSTSFSLCDLFYLFSQYIWYLEGFVYNGYFYTYAKITFVPPSYFCYYLLVSSNIEISSFIFYSLIPIHQYLI